MSCYIFLDSSSVYLPTFSSSSPSETGIFKNKFNTSAKIKIGKTCSVYLSNLRRYILENCWFRLKRGSAPIFKSD